MAEINRIPIIKLYDNLIVSIQVALSDLLVNQLKQDITDRIVDTHARGLIIDLSGIDLMDSYISRALRDLGMIARLMGVTTVISGMDPIVSVALVQMGLDIKGMHSALNLEGALELLEEQRADEDLALDEVVNR